jgi:SAM-dependent methyltransferase
MPAYAKAFTGGRAMAQEIDKTKAQAFARRVFDLYTGAALTLMINIGYRTGLFDGIAQGPGTSAEIARRAGLTERYVREWLGAMATGGIVTLDPASGVYALPPEHALCLSGANRLNVAPGSALVTHLAKHVPAIIEAFRHGGGIPYSVYRPEFTQIMDESWRRIYDQALIGEFLPAVPGLPERLAAGARVADVGCGTGHAINLMAQAYPRSTFVGYDFAADAIRAAAAEAESLGLSNARFQVQDVARLPADPKYDVLFAFDAIHDQVDPAGVLGRIRAALTPGGVFAMIDFKGTSDVHEDMANPFAPYYYTVSTLHCMTVSLAHGGAGLGTMWGERVARKMLAEAGFGQVTVKDSPRPQNSIYICQAD